jgi:trans-aconitate methyltransferase
MAHRVWAVYGTTPTIWASPLAASLGHSVIGVDRSPKILVAAKAKLPDAEFHEGDLHRLPVG